MVLIDASSNEYMQAVLINASSNEYKDIKDRMFKTREPPVVLLCVYDGNRTNHQCCYDGTSPSKKTTGKRNGKHSKAKQAQQQSKAKQTKQQATANGKTPETVLKQ